jgi:tRNA 2-thiouridine synthesizing protein A
MSAVVHIDRTIDGRGVRCPTPLESLIRAIHEARVGDVCEVLSADPVSKIDIRAWTHKAGHDLIEVVDEEGVSRHVVRKTR